MEFKYIFLIILLIFSIYLKNKNKLLTRVILIVFFLFIAFELYLVLIKKKQRNDISIYYFNIVSFIICLMVILRMIAFYN